MSLPNPNRAAGVADQPSRAARLLTYALALGVTPVLHGWSFAPHHAAWLAWIAFVPWFAAARVASTGGAVAITSWTTLLGAYLAANWLPDAVATYYMQGQVVGVALFVGVWALTVGPYVALFALLYRAAARRFVISLPLLAGMAYAGCELMRVRTLIGDPFELFGYSQVEVLPLMQMVSVTGIYGITFLLAAVNAAVAELWIAGLCRRELRRPLLGLGVAVALAVAVAAAGWRVLQAPPLASSSGVPIAIVQGNLDLGSQWRQEFYGRNLEAYLRLSLQALRPTPPRLVIWPESAMTFFLDEEPMYRASLASLFGPGKIELIAGGPRATGQKPDQSFFNSAFLVAPDGSIRARYDKQQLLPFAEYFPFGGNSLLRRQFARVREFTPGAEVSLLPTVAGRAGVVICNEVMFGEIAGARVADGAEFLVNLANDSWLGQEKYAEQAFDMARVRAIEQRRFLVRASTSGPSAVVDPLGRVVVRSLYDNATTLAGNIEPRREVSLYGRIGDLFGVVCLVLAASAALLGRLSGR